MASSPAGQEQRIEARIWQELQRATRDRHHEWRTPVLASLGPEQQVDARTVVLRRVDIEGKVFEKKRHQRKDRSCQIIIGNFYLNPHGGLP
ncbi:MAG: hypothetical protein EBV16_04705 [Betaproteobacteria bacterium]|nr:hypothetical protein [Betaproteobacteria bacterium]